MGLKGLGSAGDDALGAGLGETVTVLAAGLGKNRAELSEFSWSLPSSPPPKLSEPSEPEDPNESDDPSEPEDPSELDDPSEPEDPSEPNDPKDPRPDRPESSDEESDPSELPSEDIEPEPRPESESPPSEDIGPEFEFMWNMLPGLPGLLGASPISSLSRAARKEAKPSTDLGSSALGSSALTSGFSGSFAAKGLNAAEKDEESGEAGSVFSGSFVSRGLNALEVYEDVACDLSDCVSCFKEPSGLNALETGDGAAAGSALGAGAALGAGFSGSFAASGLNALDTGDGAEGAAGAEGLDAAGLEAAELDAAGPEAEGLDTAGLEAAAVLFAEPIGLNALDMGAEGAAGADALGAAPNWDAGLGVSFAVSSADPAPGLKDGLGLADTLSDGAEGFDSIGLNGPDAEGALSLPAPGLSLFFFSLAGLNALGAPTAL